MNTSTPALLQVNGVVLSYPNEGLTTEALRQRACAELLRQAAIQAGLLAADDPQPLGGAMTEAASTAIETLLDRELHVPEPSDEALRRHHTAQRGRYALGERVQLRHVLFAVTPGVDVNALRQRAEACLLDVRCASPGGEDRFAAAASSTSNCPSGADGGALGWLTTEDCAPEFAREIFGKPEVGVLPRLVHSRFGLHVVEVMARQAGVEPSFDAVKSAVAQALRQQAFATALRQYLQLLAGNAHVEGVQLDSADTPLVQ
ncbi:MAG: peptidylprolyl isomerase [Rubrivivax sp.]|nr:peptidylprolyl isomerase [Rubrivivax sp.]MDP3612930.1 peptidylprolyl isomerase [Rubrivivax sp.]